MDVGCRPYMAPERIDPATACKGYTIQSDVWSYGITLVSGRRDGLGEPKRKGNGIVMSTESHRNCTQYVA